MKFIRNFMLIIGPVSSIFDFLTFYIMLTVFHSGEALFHTGWFIESMATQVLVIFIIRTRKNPLKSRPESVRFDFIAEIQDFNALCSLPIVTPTIIGMNIFRYNALKICGMQERTV